MMQQVTKLLSNSSKKTLKDFIPLIIAFFGSLVVLSVYQNIRLYLDGVLDSFINYSFFLLLLHHTGFTAVAALFLAFLFNYLESKKANLGFRVVRFILFVLLLSEGLLIEYYVRNYEVLGFTSFSFNHALLEFWPIILSGLGLLFVSGFVFRFLSGVMTNSYRIINRMYPFTIILFSLFLATLIADKKPINENKTQHVLSSFVSNFLDFNQYNSPIEYPLLRTYNQQDDLGRYFNLTSQKPNIVILIVEGLGSDFLGDKAIYDGFTPYLESIRNQSLYWENFLSNTGESFAALPTIVGSLPFGKEGFSNIDGNLNKNTLFSILKSNGYATSFNYGGNSALNHLDKFLDEERVDYILDSKSYGPDYTAHEKDAARISLGYPDKELFRKFMSLDSYLEKPKFDVFLTQSTKKPFLVPSRENYMNKVDQILVTSQKEKNLAKRIRKNKEIFASLLYADEALSVFLEANKSKAHYKNTLFIITGSHNLTELPAKNEISRYQVPFMIYSPLIKAPKKINSTASHADIVPSLLSLLNKKYSLKVPSKVSWLGNGLAPEKIDESSRQIPLFRNKNNIQDYIHGRYLLSSGRIYGLEENLELVSVNNAPKRKIKEAFKAFKSINTYVTAHDKIVPDSNVVFKKSGREFTKQEMVWISSVFNGKNFDNAFETARELAFRNEWDRAKLLCEFILAKIPRHADTEILMGRIYAWQKEYNSAIETLEEVIRKYPIYIDGYSALLDVYFWADKNERAVELLNIMERNNLKSVEIDQKMTRAHRHLQQQTTETKKVNFSIKTKSPIAVSAVHQE